MAQDAAYRAVAARHADIPQDTFDADWPELAAAPGPEAAPAPDSQDVDALMSALMRPAFIRAMARSQCHPDTPRGQGAVKRLVRAENAIDAIVRHYVDGSLRDTSSRHRQECDFHDVKHTTCSCGQWDSHTSSRWFEEHAYGRD